MRAVFEWYERVCARTYYWARPRIAPHVLNSQYEYARVLRSVLGGKGRWLDLGCGHATLPEWMIGDAPQLPIDNWVRIGIDMDETSIRRHPTLTGAVVGNVEQLPFRSGSFDVITANMVLEHVERPEPLFRELHRALSDNGIVLVHTPNRRGYTTLLTKLLPDSLVTPLAGRLLHRAPEDVYPTFYRANTPRDLAKIGEHCGLALESAEYVNSSAQMIRLLPFIVFELLLIRALESPRFAPGRACIIASFRKSRS
jgi:SAM-dependent methyltransferase